MSNYSEYIPEIKNFENEREEERDKGIWTRSGLSDSSESLKDRVENKH